MLVVDGPARRVQKLRPTLARSSTPDIRERFQVRAAADDDQRGWLPTTAGVRREHDGRSWLELAACLLRFLAQLSGLLTQSFGLVRQLRIAGAL